MSTFRCLRQLTGLSSTGRSKFRCRLNSPSRRSKRGGGAGGSHDDDLPAENHLRRTAQIRRPRCAGLLPRPRRRTRRAMRCAGSGRRSGNTKARFSRLTNGCALECGVGFRQLRTCRRTRPGQRHFRTHSTQRRNVSSRKKRNYFSEELEKARRRPEHGQQKQTQPSHTDRHRDTD
jgi:hypothetical protein